MDEGDPQRKGRHTRRWAIASLVFSITLIAPFHRVQAQLNLTPDTASNRSLGTTVIPFSPQVDVVTGGTRPNNGPNLFHSFEAFNIRAGRSIFFENPSGIERILTRVTGNDPSNILGTLGVQGTADFYLINPNGIIFGPRAALDVGGSFTATTANAIQLGEAGIFSANINGIDNLLAVAPSALIFATQQSRPIINRSSQEFVGLEVPVGERLQLIAGNVRINNGRLVALAGSIDLGSVRGTGIVEFDANGRLIFPEEPARGDVSVTEGSLIAVLSNNGGDISITARNILFSESELLAGIFPEQGRETSQAGNIWLNASGNIEVRQSVIANNVEEGAVGNAGDIEITANSLLVHRTAQLQTLTRGRGNSGNLLIQVRDHVIFDGSSGRIPSSAFSGVAEGGTGQGGDIEINADSLALTNGATLSSSTIGQGDAGNVRIQARNQITLEGTTTNSQLRSQISTFISQGGRGQGGDLVISTGSLFLLNGAVLSASTFGQGDAGNVIINVRDRISFDGTSSDNRFPGGVSSLVGSSGQGNGGNISIYTSSLSLFNGAVVSSSTDGLGNAGNVFIQARGSISLDGNATGEGISSGVFSAARNTARGEGGLIRLEANSLSLSNQAVISSTSDSQEQAGNIVIDANSVTINDSLVSAAADRSLGGDIRINTNGDPSNRIVLLRNGDIATESFGRGGDISILGGGIIALEDTDIIARSQAARSGNITLGPFFSDTIPIDNLEPFDEDGRVDVDADGSLTISSVDFIQRSLSDLPQVLIDTNALLASSCIVRRGPSDSSFFITGLGGLPEHPGAIDAGFPTGEVRTVPQAVDGGQEGDRPTPATETSSWQMGDPIIEPQGVYQLPTGELVLGREC